MSLRNKLSRRSVSAGLAVLALTLIFSAAMRAQTVIPTVCVTPNARTGTTTVTTNAAVDQAYLALDTQNSTLPQVIRIIVNPGGATEETFLFASPLSSGSGSYHLRPVGGSNFRLIYAHSAGETVRWFTDTTATFGYNNTSGSEVFISRGLSSGNYFAPGATTYPQQTNNFLPGIHNNAFSIDLPTQGGAGITWYLDGGQARVSSDTPACATITYQGRLSDAGAAANGTYDLQFTAYDQLTGGTAQSESIVVQDATVTNGIFTVQLSFAASFYNNYNAKYLEIAVRPGASTGAFTTLQPRQPITKVPYAVNADNAAQLNGIAASRYVLTTDSRLSSTNNANFIQNTTTQQTANFNISGNGTIGGSLTVGGAINGTATNATQLGGVAASDYLTTSGSLGQNVTTAGGSAALTVDATTTAYTLLPGLTQTINVPANSALMISTDGGILSSGAINTYSVVDVAIFVDGAPVNQKRIVVGNNPLPYSLGNWASSIGQTLTAGNHTIEVRARNAGVPNSSGATVSNGSDPLLRGQLTIAVIRK